MNRNFNFHHLPLNPVNYVLQFGVRYFQSRFSGLERVESEDFGNSMNMIEKSNRCKGAYQIFGEEVVNDDDVEVQELCHGAENVGSDGLEVLHQMDVLSAEAQQHQRSICQDGQLQSPSVSRRGAAKI